MTTNPSTIDNNIRGHKSTDMPAITPSLSITPMPDETVLVKAETVVSKNRRKTTTIIRDPIHGFIDLSYYDFIPKIIQTAMFQRLRRLSQLGVSVFVYPSATHNRFNHSLGAMQLFVGLFDHLYKDEPHDNDYEKLRMTGIASVLLHDIGHGPFSHASEQVFGFDHEDISNEIIESTEIRDILQSPGIRTADITSVISKTATGKMKLLSQLISSQLDVDRLDYLARDVYFTGVGFGGVDLDRLIRTTSIYHGESFLDGYAVVEEKGRHSVEAFLLTRSLMYDDVYYHKTTRCVEKLIEGIFERIKELSSEKKNGCFKPPRELEFIQRMEPKEGSKNIICAEDILPLDDHYIYSLLLQWSKDSGVDPILYDFSRRILQRKLFKSIELPSGGLTSLLTKKNAVEKLVSENLRLDPKYYCILDEPRDRPYQPVGAPTSDEEIQESLKENIYIKLKDGSGFKEISEISDVVDALTKRRQLIRLYFPEEIRQAVNDIVNPKDKK